MSERGGAPRWAARRARSARRPAMLVAGVLAVGVVAAACSSGEPVGLVGTSLSANGAQITLTAVYAPATASNNSVAQPAYGHEYVATLLNVRNLSDSSVDLTTLYRMAKLRDNKRRDHLPSATGTVTQCQRLDSLGQLQPHQTASGCAIFDLSMVARPVKLFIKSTPQVSWAIRSGVIQPEPTGGEAIGAVPATTQPPAGTNSSASDSGSTGNTGSGGGGAPAAQCTGNTGAGSTGSGCQGGGTPLASGFNIVTTALPGVTAGGAYSDQLVASGGATPYHWRRISGSLPKGIHIGSQGLLFGRTRATRGTYSFTVEVKDSTPHGHLEAVQNLSLTVS